MLLTTAAVAAVVLAGLLGYHLHPAQRREQRYRQYEKAARLYEQGKFAECAPIFERLLEKIKADKQLFRLTISALSRARQPARALAYDDQRCKLFKSSPDDIFTRAVLLSETGQHQKAIKLYTKLLEADPPYAAAYNNRGYTYGLIDLHEAAIVDCTRAIEAGVHVAYAYNNRGYSKLKLGLYEKGLADIRKGLELDEQDAYAYRNLGIYYFELKDYHQALMHFELAYSMDEHMPFLDDYLWQTRQLLAT